MKVSALVMTYNHERFIEQALESALMQRVSSQWEIIISEDCSTDRTREIVVAYQKRHPGRIRLLLSQQNLHSNAVVVRGIQAAKGQYIALLDGDDYWTSPTKLQKQVDFLDSHHECAICFHNASVVHEDGIREAWNWTPAGQPEISTFEDIWMGNFIATCSTMFRRGLIREFPNWYESLFPITDWPLHILNAEHGKIGYIDEVMGAYRYHSGGLYSSLSESRKLQETLKFYQVMNANLGFRYDALIKRAIFEYFSGWAEEYARRGDVERAKACLATSLKGQPLTRPGSLRKLVRLGLRLVLSRPSTRATAQPSENSTRA